MKFSRPLRWLLLLGVLILAVFPFVGAEYYTELVVRIMIFGIFAMSLDLLIGFTGLVSFGHAAFFGLAGYMLAIITPETSGVSLFWSLPLSILVSGLAARHHRMVFGSYHRHLLHNDYPGIRTDGILLLPGSGAVGGVRWDVFVLPTHRDSR